MNIKSITGVLCGFALRPSASMLQGSGPRFSPGGAHPVRLTSLPVGGLNPSSPLHLKTKSTPKMGCFLFSRSRTRTYDLRVMSMPRYALLKSIACYLGLLKHSGIHSCKYFGWLRATKAYRGFPRFPTPCVVLCVVLWDSSCWMFKTINKGITELRQ